MNINFMNISKQEHFLKIHFIFSYMNLTIPSKLKLVGVYHNINTHEQLIRAKHVKNSKDVNNYL
jgi:hypothetical protein